MICPQQRPKSRMSPCGMLMPNAGAYWLYDACSPRTNILVSAMGYHCHLLLSNTRSPPSSLPQQGKTAHSTGSGRLPAALALAALPQWRAKRRLCEWPRTQPPADVREWRSETQKVEGQSVQQRKRSNHRPKAEGIRPKDGIPDHGPPQPVLAHLEQHKQQIHTCARGKGKDKRA